jgi:hypothetical protein
LKIFHVRSVRFEFTMCSGNRQGSALHLLRLGQLFVYTGRT